VGGQTIAAWLKGKIAITAVSDVKSTQEILRYMKNSIPKDNFDTKSYKKFFEDYPEEEDDEEKIKFSDETDKNAENKHDDSLRMKKIIYATEGIDEEVPTVSTAGVAGLDTGLTFKKKKEDEKKAKILRRKLIGEIKMSKFAGKDVFIVDSDIYHACRLGKKKYHRYEKYVGNNTIGLAIREFGLKYPKRPIILQNGESGPMLYLKYGRS
jgi:hypothetical protein